MQQVLDDSLVSKPYQLSLFSKLPQVVLSIIWTNGCVLSFLQAPNWCDLKWPFLSSKLKAWVQSFICKILFGLFFTEAIMFGFIFLKNMVLSCLPRLLFEIFLRLIRFAKAVCSLKELSDACEFRDCIMWFSKKFIIIIKKL